MLAKAELLGLSYSPWTEKARWALEHHGIPFRYSEHMLFFGMLSARIKLRRLTSEVTVSASIHQNARMIDSFQIAQYADSHGSGSRLFPKERFSEIEAWNEISDASADAHRALVIDRVLKDKEARVEAVPPFIPPLFRRVMSLFAGFIV